MLGISINAVLKFVTDWFSASLPGFNACLSSEVRRMDLPNLFVTPPFVVLPEHLEADSIHLTGKLIFIQSNSVITITAIANFMATNKSY